MVELTTATIQGLANKIQESILSVGPSKYRDQIVDSFDVDQDEYVIHTDIYARFWNEYRGSEENPADEWVTKIMVKIDNGKAIDVDGEPHPIDLTEEVLESYLN